MFPGGWDAPAGAWGFALGQRNPARYSRRRPNPLFSEDSNSSTDEDMEENAARDLRQRPGNFQHLNIRIPGTAQRPDVEEERREVYIFPRILHRIRVRVFRYGRPMSDFVACMGSITVGSLLQQLSASRHRARARLMRNQRDITDQVRADQRIPELLRQHGGAEIEIWVREEERGGAGIGQIPAEYLLGPGLAFEAGFPFAAGVGYGHGLHAWI